MNKQKSGWAFPAVENLHECLCCVETDDVSEGRRPEKEDSGASPWPVCSHESAFCFFSFLSTSYVPLPLSAELLVPEM